MLMLIYYGQDILYSVEQSRDRVTVDHFKTNYLIK